MEWNLIASSRPLQDRGRSQAVGHELSQRTAATRHLGNRLFREEWLPSAVNKSAEKADKKQAPSSYCSGVGV